jgi:hypothetical protein
MSKQSKQQAAAEPEVAAVETAAERVARLQAELKAARAEAKTSKQSRPSSKPGCRLFAMEGSDTCSNHRPALSKLTAAEQTALSTWLEGRTPNELLHAWVDGIGWAKAKEQAKGLATAPLAD